MLEISLVFISLSEKIVSRAVGLQGLEATADANRYTRLIALLGKIPPILRSLTEL